MNENDIPAVTDTRCGYIAIVGRPNVGKSTLLNHLLRQKVSITSRKPQTPRHRILGIHTQDGNQYVFVDTPGLHRERKKPLNRIMNETVIKTIKDVDLILMVVDKLAWTDEDELVLAAVSRANAPVLLLINKIDLIPDKPRLLPHMELLAGKADFAEIIPLSALKDDNFDRLFSILEKYLPPGPFLFPPEQVTDRSSRFVAAEMIREKITRQLGDELPYETNVEIEKYATEGQLLVIHGLILVDKPGQKQIIIGKDGERLKLIGSEARKDMEKMFQSKVLLKLWVKVRSGWADDERALQSLGYTSD